MKVNVNAKNESKKSVKNYITLAEYNAAYEHVWGDDYTKRNWTTSQELNGWRLGGRFNAAKPLL